MLTVLAGVAEFERSLILARTEEGKKPPGNRASSLSAVQAVRLPEEHILTSSHRASHRTDRTSVHVTQPTISYQLRPEGTVTV